MGAMDATPSIGTRIKSRRLEKGWSREKLAARALVHLNTLTLIENGDTQPSTRVLGSICQQLGLRLTLVDD